MKTKGQQRDKEQRVWKEEESIGLENRPKEGWIYSIKVYIVSVQQYREPGDQFSSPWSSSL